MMRRRHKLSLQENDGDAAAADAVSVGRVNIFSAVTELRLRSRAIRQIDSVDAQPSETECTYCPLFIAGYE